MSLGSIDHDMILFISHVIITWWRKISPKGKKLRISSSWLGLTIWPMVIAICDCANVSQTDMRSFLCCLYQEGLFALRLTLFSSLCEHLVYVSLAHVVINCTGLFYSHDPSKIQTWHIFFPGQSTDLFIRDKYFGQSVFFLRGGQEIIML